MSENLNKEMEEVVEDTLEEETPSAHKSVKGKGGVVAPVTTPENQQKDKSGVKHPKQMEETGVAYKEETEVEEETEELEESLPRLKSEMVDGLVKHMKGLKKEDLAAQVVL